MSMIGYLMRVPRPVCEALVAGTEDAQDVLPDIDEMMVWFAGKEGDDARGVCVHKLWHAIHFVLAGSPWDTDGELGDLFMGGDEVGDDMGYGPARLLEPDRVAALHRQLTASPDAVLRPRFVPAELAAEEIYPDIWDEDEDELWQELTSYLAGVRTILGRASDAGDGLLVWLS